MRLSLLELLNDQGPLTASQCAELLGLSPKVCSYHLNLLGSYGLVTETGTGKGRARPWEVATSGFSYVHHADEDGATRRAADEFSRTMLARNTGLIESFIRNRHKLPEHWRNVAPMSTNTIRLTSDQLAALGSDLYALLDRYRELARASSDTDADTRPVHIGLYAVPVEPTDLTDAS